MSIKKQLTRLEQEIDSNPPPPKTKEPTRAELIESIKTRMGFIDGKVVDSGGGINQSREKIINDIREMIGGE